MFIVGQPNSPLKLDLSHFLIDIVSNWQVVFNTGWWNFPFHYHDYVDFSEYSTQILSLNWVLYEALCFPFLDFLFYMKFKVKLLYCETWERVGSKMFTFYILENSLLSLVKLRKIKTDNCQKPSWRTLVSTIYGSPFLGYSDNRKETNLTFKYSSEFVFLSPWNSFGIAAWESRGDAIDADVHSTLESSEDL